MKVVPYKDWVKKKKGRVPAILHFQPMGFIELETPAEIKEWQAQLVLELGISPDVAESFTWGTPTFSGDADRNPSRTGDSHRLAEPHPTRTAPGTHCRPLPVVAKADQFRSLGRKAPNSAELSRVVERPNRREHSRTLTLPTQEHVRSRYP